MFCRSNTLSLAGVLVLTLGTVALAPDRLGKQTRSIPTEVTASGASDALRTFGDPTGNDADRLASAVAPKLELSYHPKHLLVRFEPGTKRVDVRAIHDALGAKLLKTYRCVEHLQLVEVSEADWSTALAAYQKQPAVLYAEPDYVVRAHAVPNDRHFNLLWGLHNTGQAVDGDPGTAGADIRAVEAWDIWTGDPEFRIAVVDTGVNYRHPDLADNIWTNYPELLGLPGVDDDGNGWVDDVHGYNMIDDISDPMDDHGHGTHIAGTIGAVANNNRGVVGVNWRCKIVALKFLGTFGSGYGSDAIEAMEYIIDNQIRVSNNSYGCYGEGCYSQALYDVIEAAQAVGHIFVAAVGNGNTDVDVTPHYPSGYDLPNIIAVASTDNDDNRASSSNYGATAVDLGAPGVFIYSTTSNNSYGFGSGTSMAAPHVAGVAGLVLSRFPGLGYADVRDVVFGTVRPVDALNGITVTGGVVHAAAALSDCNANGVPDADDITGGASSDCTANGIPDECEGDCNSNAVADSCDIEADTSDDCNANGLPDECEPGWDQDCDEDGTSDLCEIYFGSGDCNRNHVPDACEPYTDCNENGIRDFCDVASGAAEDLNHNGLLDECEENRLIYVDDDAPFDPGPGDPTMSDPAEDGSVEHPFDAIQEAINVAVAGDEVVVHQGIYTGVGNRDLDFGGRRITLRSTTPTDQAVVANTVIDCQSNGRAFFFHHGEGLHSVVTGLTIRNGRVEYLGVPTDAAHGGAIYCLNSSPTIANCRFQANWARECWIDSCWGAGGAMYNLISAPAVINCVFEDNWAGEGGGAVFGFDSSAQFDNCLFVANFAGGGMAFGYGGALVAGGGAPALTNCTLFDNHADSGGGIYNAGSTPILTNCILWGNWDEGGTGQSAQVHVSSGSVTVDYSCIQGLTGNLGGLGNIGDDPVFADAEAYDVHLRGSSQCIDAGHNAVVTLGTDLEGSPRLLDYTAVPDTGSGAQPIVDMGVYEYHGDCNGNGIEDVTDIANETSEDCNLNGIPDECEPDEDCNINEVKDICDIALESSADCDGNYVPDECEPDCNANGVADACDIRDGTSEDCNSNGVPDECEPDEDCNNNGTRDICDIGTGESPDCNGNVIPDECDISAGTSPDGNGNGVPDECQGACCVCSECVDTTEDDCLTQGGTFTTLGTMCPLECPTYEDDCLDMVVLPSDPELTVPTDNRCASDDGPTPVPCGEESEPFGADVWFGYPAPCDGDLTVSMCDNTDYDAIVAIYDGGPICECPTDDSTQVVCGDNTCGVTGGPPTVTTSVDGGTCYTIRVAGWDGARGLGEMSISLTCFSAIDAPQPEPEPVDKNRYISFVPTNPYRQTALRVTLAHLPEPFAEYEGTIWWVGVPSVITESAGSSGSTPPPTFKGATLQCTPYYRGWSSVGLLDVYGGAIVPGATYDVQAIDARADTADDDNYSAPLTINTSRWCDIVGDCSVTPCAPPDGIMDFVDISALVDKFKNTPTAIRKARADITGSGSDDAFVNRKIDFIDISNAVDAFRGSFYPFEMPDPCPAAGG